LRQPRPSSADGGANRQLALSAGPARAQQAGDVHASDEQRSGDGAEHQPQRPPRIGGHRRHERRHDRIRVNRRALVLRLGDRRELRLSCLNGDAAGPANDHDVVELAPRLARAVRPGEGPEELERIVDAIRHRQLWQLRQAECRRQNADDLDRDAVEREDPPDHRRIGGEPALPEAVRDDHHLVSPWRILITGEGPPEHRRDPEHIE
jgi:hypothetical protein